GYIYQVTDAAHGELLTGPQYPDPYPDVFDGQGAPDMFFDTLGGATAAVGDEVGVIGVGRVRRTSSKQPFYVRDNPEVIEFLPWQVTRSADSITMQTEQVFADWAYRLIRRVTLRGRTVDSHTEIENLGQAILPVRWFAHPFFPLTPDQVYCRFSTSVSFPESPGYFLNEEGFICQKAEFDWNQTGCYQALDYAKTGDSMMIEQRHPALGGVTTVTDFLPDFLPVWSNSRTFSFEPYLIKQLATGEGAAWRIAYQF
ncbi:MAG: hypothetical protein M3Q45_06255, partial [Chloroflexota bacterium]|nr:hypothetical protein [Chloroflexota bacterium]